VKLLNTWITIAIALAGAPAVAQTTESAQANWWSQAGGENGPERVVWAAQKTPETPYAGVSGAFCAAHTTRSGPFSPPA